MKETQKSNFKFILHTINSHNPSVRSIMNTLVMVVSLVSLFIYHVLHNVFRFLMPKSLRKKKDISRQKVLITGAGNGLGRQLALQFSELSTCLVLLDIDEEALRQTARLIVRNSGSRVLIYKCDVSDRKMVYAVAKKIKDDVGDIDILVNNAGVVCGKSLIDLPDEKIQKTLEVNAIAHFWVSFYNVIIITAYTLHVLKILIT